MSQIRKMTFGKYKGQPILRVIAEHIGYIMWCFENIDWFSLNDVEQKFYDWQAIAIKKYHIPMIFPVESMYKHVKDQVSLQNLETPYRFIGYDPYLPNTEISHLLREAGVIQCKTESQRDTNWRMGLAWATRHMVDSMEEEEINEMTSMGFEPPIDFGLCINDEPSPYILHKNG